MIGRADITGVILCGGEARRMSGAEKPLLVLDALPLVAHVRARLAPQVQRVIVSANRSHDSYAAYGDEVVSDHTAGAGPLAGLSVALHASSSRPVGATPYLFACPGDAPFLDRQLVARLAQAMTDAEADVAVPHDGTRAQHLFLLLRTIGQPSSVGLSLQAYLDGGERSVHGWLDTQRVVRVDAADIADSFVNINTPQDLLDAQHHVSHTLHQDQEPL